MAVPNIFANVPGGSNIQLVELDQNFAYLATSPTLTSLTLLGTLTVGGAATFNNTTIFNGPIKIGPNTVTPTGVTGTGKIVLSDGPLLNSPLLNSPIFSNANLGTPSAGNLQNCTNLPISTGVSGLGAGVAAALSNAPDTAGGFVTYSSNTMVPTGAVFYFAAAAAPAGYLVCDGASYATATYPDLFAITGYTFGGAGATFNVPNLTGQFVRGVGGNSAALGVTQADSIGAHNHGITDPGHTHAVTDPGHQHNLNDPLHTHATNDPGHTHTVTDPGHTHNITDAGHAHGITDPGHTHTLTSRNAGTAGLGGGTVMEQVLPYDVSASNVTGVTINTNTTGIINLSNTTGVTNAVNTTGFQVFPQFSGVTCDPINTGITNNSNATGITVNNTGGVETRPTNVALLPCIKY